MHPTVRKAVEQVAVMGIVALLLIGALAAWMPVKVSGWSMHPALHPGDLAFVRRGQPISAGDIVLFRSPGHAPVLHRVVHVDGSGRVQTRGDANDIVDRDSLLPSAVTGPVRAVAPVGRLLSRWRDGHSCATMTVQSNSTKR